MYNKIKILTILLALISASVTVSAENVKPYNGSRIFWDMNSRTTVFAHGGYARIIQLQDGRLMATCESNGIDISFSNDMGKTWCAPIKIVTNKNNTPNCVPDLIQLKDGTIIVAYNPRPSEPFTADRKFGIRCKRSTDNGVTWSDEIFVNDASHTFNDGCWEPSMLELPSGELQLYYADEGPYTNSNEQQISMRRSQDGGLTWGSVNRIAFRSGYRDGMPVPVLLNDRNTIVVAIEDNGWPGYNDFFPTTVRCDISKNWKRYCVTGDSENRDKTLDLNYCPLAKGGAPYIRVLPWGETVLSWQSTYNHGQNNTMFTAVGNSDAREFKAMSNPFVTSDSERVLWNSLAVVDTGIVVAVGGVNGKIEMIKGYPMRMIQAPFGKPSVDGIQTDNEGYFKQDATQIMLGTQTGVRSTSDFAYDEKFLYFTARIDDNTDRRTSSAIDGIRLFLDMADAVSDNPVKGMYTFFMRRDSTYQALRGENGKWTSDNTIKADVKVRSTNSGYVVEAAIPWTTFGMTEPPTGRRMGTTLEIVDRRESTTLTEYIPDAQRNKSCTYMEFRLIDRNETNGITSAETESNNVKVSINGNKLTIDSNSAVKNLVIYTPDGRMTAHASGNGTYASANIPTKGFAITKITLDDGTVINKKIVVGQ